MKYKILQVKDFENCNYLFTSYERAVKYGFNLDDYEVVYEGDRDFDYVDDLDCLEQLFYIFNCQHPKDFKGHSLSVSDIVWLNGKYYYVDSFGYQLIKEGN